MVTNHLLGESLMKVRSPIGEKALLPWRPTKSGDGTDTWYPSVMGATFVSIATGS